MRLIIQYKETDERFLSQFTKHLTTLGTDYRIMDIDEQTFSSLSNSIHYVEPDFAIELHTLPSLSQEILYNDIVLVTIGAENKDTRIDAYYDIATHTLLSRKPLNNSEYRWIHCYNAHNKMYASEYIYCIHYIKNLTYQCQKPVIIYSNIYVPNEAYRYRSLTYKIINNDLNDLSGVLISKTNRTNRAKYYIPSQRHYEFYEDYTLYLDDPMNDAIKKIIPFVSPKHSLGESPSIDQQHRQNVLFNNIFYEAIDPDQEIYMTLVPGTFRTPDEYRALGFDYISLVGGYGVLYGRRRRFDELTEILRQEVAQPYFIPILSQEPYSQEIVSDDFTYSVSPDNLRYKGNGTYIGVISVDEVDYTSPALRRQDGTSRIAYIWEQLRVDQGMAYFNEQINQSLTSPDPGQIISLPAGDSISTMILGIAGGQSQVPNYQGVATEAEFVIAKINTAPEILQKIYGGTPSKNTVTMADLLIAAVKLIEFAVTAGRPLVLCIPFNTNIDPHDGSLILYELLGLLSASPALTIIVPAGEEADKYHHYQTNATAPTLETININVPAANQGIMGVLYQKFPTIASAALYSPLPNAPVFDLTQRGSTAFGQSSVYSDGYLISFLNGAARIVFRLENPLIGTWRIELTFVNGASAQTDIWITKQSLNEFITLYPSNVFITIGSLASIPEVITVGAYNQNHNVILRSSGRGYNWNNLVKPSLVTYGQDIIAPYGQGLWIKTSGTVPAASIIAGVAATIYGKVATERYFPSPNTRVMLSLILSRIEQRQGIEFPNPSYGYGLFLLKSLNEILSSPLPIQ